MTDQSLRNMLLDYFIFFSDASTVDEQKLLKKMAVTSMLPG